MDDPWCIVFGTFHNVLRIMSLPERLIPWAEQHQWIVLVRDSDIPKPRLTNEQSNPRRPRHGEQEQD